MKLGVYGDPPSEDYLNAVYKTFYESLYNRRGRWFVFLRKYVGGDTFVREFAHPQRRIVTNITQLHKQLLFFGYQKRNRCYISNYNFRQVKEAPMRRGGKKQAPDYETAVINNAAYDFDATEDRPLSEVWNDVIKFWMITKVENNFEPEIWFTGGRGFLVRYRKDFSSKGELREHQIAMHKKAHDAGIRSIDTGHFGDVARVYGIPFTPHTVTGRFMVPVHIKMTIDDIVKSSEMVKIGLW